MERPAAPGELEARRQRMAEHARRERAALNAVDRAAARLVDAEGQRSSMLAKAEAVVAEATHAHRQALAAYARFAGPERAAYCLDLDARELRRLAKEAAE